MEIIAVHNPDAEFILVELLHEIQSGEPTPDYDDVFHNSYYFNIMITNGRKRSSKFPSLENE